MKTSNNGIAFLKGVEGLSLVPYLDSNSVPTIGNGATHYANGQRVTMQDEPITEKQADTLLMRLIPMYEKEVNTLVTVPLNQNQYDALVSFVYNIGGNQFMTSTFLKKLNTLDYIGAANEFKRWKYSGGKVIQGLINRRAKEKVLFLMAVDKQEFEMTDTKKWYESSTIKSALVTLLTMIASLFSIDFGDITTLIDLIQQTVVQGVAIVMSISAIVGRVKAVTRIVK